MGVPESVPVATSTTSRRPRAGQGIASLCLASAGILIAAMGGVVWANDFKDGKAIGIAAAITLAGVLAIAAIYRRIRVRFLAISAIGKAVMESAVQDGSRSSLRLRDDLGPEAVAWNALLREADTARTAVVADRTRAALGDRRGNGGDFEAACESLSIGMLIIDKGFTVRQVNGAAATLLQVKRDAIVGSTVAKLIPDANVATALTAVAGGSGQRRTVEMTRNDPTGQTIFRIQIRPTRRDDAGSVLVTIDDVTQQRLADAARNTFITQATHELRAPLTNMRLCLETAIEDLDERPEALREHLNVLNTESRRLERMVSEMLSIAEIEAGSMRLKSDDVRLEKLFEELATDFARMAVDKQIGLKFDLPPKFPVLHGDRDKLMLSLQNLVGNAIKYTPAGGKVTVSLREEAGTVAIDISDTGIGIKDEERGRIFDRFYRAQDDRVSKITGTGLGLSLAREVARLHGGDVSVQSELDKGSTFTLTLPPPRSRAA
jgi:signal transduction histidine kinase